MTRIQRKNSMSHGFKLAVCLLLVAAIPAVAQRGGKRQGNSGKQGPRPTDIEDNPMEIGAPGVAWYTTWETGLAEAKRTNRPIFFMSAATTCSGISGVF